MQFLNELMLGQFRDLAMTVAMISASQWAGEPIPTEYTKYIGIESNAPPATAWISTSSSMMPRETGIMEIPHMDVAKIGRRLMGRKKTYSISTGYHLSAMDSELGKRMITEAVDAVRRGYELIKEYQVADLMLRGFTTVTTPDGVSLFNNAHSTVNRNKSWANRPPAPMDLSAAALTLARSHYHRRYDDNGEKVVHNPGRKLVIQAHQEQLAFELLNSDLKPGTNGATQVNDVNFHKGLAQPEVWHYVDNNRIFPNCWFLIDDSKDKGLKLMKVNEVSQRDVEDKEKELLKTIFKSEWYYMLNHAYWIWGSPGT